MSGEPVRKSQAIRWLLSVFITLMLYVLSWGPYVGLAWRGVFHSEPKWIYYFYRPIVWLNNNTALNRPIQAYEKWWIKVLKK